MSPDPLTDHLVPVIVTNFYDFELEERAVRILAHQGFRIGDRKIGGAREVGSEEILITDSISLGSDIPVITIPREAKEWSDARLHRFLQDQLFPPLTTIAPSPDRPAIVIIGGESHPVIGDELLTTLNQSGFNSALTSFDEADLRGALVPTRRLAERERYARYAFAHAALFLLGMDRREAARAHSMIEYQRRIQRHLRLAFVVIGGRKSQRIELSSLLAPFPIFTLDDQSDDLFRLPKWRKARGDAKFLAIQEWLGSPYGDPRQPGDLKDRALTGRTRPSRRTGGAVAVTR